ncbi:MAG: hypothetical protein MUO19_08995, partial [Dehalococcoidales bacterium]|nr:hypothetical protein [Dehalococcoidales bacterium]
HRAVKKTGLVASVGNNTFTLSANLEDTNSTQTEDDGIELPSGFGLDVSQDRDNEPDDLPF